MIMTSVLKDLVFFAGAFTVACLIHAGCVCVNSALAADSVSDSKTESANAVEASPQAAGAITETTAVRLAEQHLALRNTRWGKPVSVVDESDAFVISYDTPETELRLVGKRSVTVRKSDGLARIRSRR